MKGGEFMAVYSVDELRMIVSDIAKQYGVKKVALFGSYSTGKQTSEIDIDILWETTVYDIPELKDYCIKCLSK